MQNIHNPDCIHAEEWVRNRLFGLQDSKYGDFHSALMPTVAKELVIGVRMPALRRLVKEMEKEPELAAEFLAQLPHGYYEENNVHGCLIAGMKDFGSLMEELEQFLPHIDNWATCDLLVPKIFKNNCDELLPYIENWLKSEHPYTVRFGIKMLMDFYLDEEFQPAYPAMAAAVKSDEYYINMMIAWYFATAMAKQWDSVIGYFAEPGKDERPVLEAWTHNKAIQKAIESFRITPEQKSYLRTLKIK